MRGQLPNNVQSWLVYGPFSLEGATDAEMVFRLWLNSEQEFDSLMSLASTNGIDFDGLINDGVFNWTERTLDLSDVTKQGEINPINLLGQPNVWIAFVFASDPEMAMEGGAFIDDVVIRKKTTLSPQKLAPSADDPTPWDDAREEPVSISRPSF